MMETNLSQYRTLMNLANMKRIPILIITMLLILPFLSSFAQNKIIFDTDIGGDADDLASLAMFHAFIDQGECDLLGIISWSTEEYAIPMIDAVNRFYGHPDIPLGIRKTVWHTNPENYGKSIADRFEYKLTNDDVADATVQYRKLLSEAKNKSITLLAVGPLYNIKALIESEADKYSKLNGRDLIHKKVKEFVIMGGQFPEGKNEWNFNGNMPGVTKFVLENIEVPVVFTGFEIGVKIKSAAVLNERDPNTPLYVGFKYFSEHASWMKQNYKGKILDNSSFDQTGVIYAVRNGVGTYWNKVENGICVADSIGGNKWVPAENSNHAYLELTSDPEEMATLIESIMLNEME